MGIVGEMISLPMSVKKLMKPVAFTTGDSPDLVPSRALIERRSIAEGWWDFTGFRTPWMPSVPAHAGPSRPRATATLISLIILFCKFFRRFRGSEPFFLPGHCAHFPLDVGIMNLPSGSGAGSFFGWMNACVRL
jgi:hypothetical protein